MTTYTTDKNLWLEWTKENNRVCDINTIEYILDNCEFAGYMFGPLALVGDKTIITKTRQSDDIISVLEYFKSNQDKIYFYSASFYPNMTQYNKFDVDSGQWTKLSKLELTDNRWGWSYGVLGE